MRNWDRLEADVVKLVGSHRYTVGRGGKRIEMVVVHHNAGVNTVEQVRDLWEHQRPASAHYQVESGGRIGQIVWDANTAWHAANTDINLRSIGVEVSNSGGLDKDWPITDTAIEEAAHLVAAICRYYSLGAPVAGRNVRFHSEFSATSCPYHLGPSGKYHERLMSRARFWYDVMSGKAPAPAPKPQEATVEKRLDYPRDQVHQDTFYNCGPATAQTIIRSRKNSLISEADLGRELRTHTGGTDWIGQFPAVLNRHIGGDYRVVEMPNDPPTAAQKDRLWSDIVRSVDAGYGVVANIVAPASNYPRAVAPSNINPSYSGGTVYHYFGVMGYAQDSRGRRAWIADSGFAPYGYWISFDQLASLIPPKGYACATVAAPKPAPAPAPTKEDPIMDRIRSLIDPRKTFTAEEVLGFIDTATWQTRALLYEVARRQGIDPKAVVDAAIAAERSK